MADEITTAAPSQGYKAEDFVAGIPSASILGLLGAAAASIAVNVGFLPNLVSSGAGSSIYTAGVVGGLVFISELVRVAYEN